MELVMVADNQELAQSVERVLTTNLGDFFLNKNMGFERSLVTQKQLNNNAIRLGVIEAITQDERIKGIRSLEINLDRQNLNVAINFDITTVNGTVEGSVII